MLYFCPCWCEYISEILYESFCLYCWYTSILVQIKKKTFVLFRSTCFFSAYRHSLPRNLNGTTARWHVVLKFCVSWSRIDSCLNVKHIASSNFNSYLERLQCKFSYIFQASVVSKQSFCANYWIRSTFCLHKTFDINLIQKYIIENAALTKHVIMIVAFNAKSNISKKCIYWTMVYTNQISNILETSLI